MLSLTGATPNNFEYDDNDVPSCMYLMLHASCLSITPT